VAEEVAYFKQLGKGDRILAVMIEGEPPGCFPKALLHPVTPDGTIEDSQKTEPIAADFRILPGGHQGWTNPAAYREALEAEGKHNPKTIRQLADDYDRRLQLARLKVLAGTLGLTLGMLTQRDKAYQLEKARRRARTLAAWLTLSMILAAAAVGGGAFAWVQRAEAIRQRDLAVGRGKVIRTNVEWMNFKLRDVLQKYAPSATLIEANRRIDELLKAVEPVGTGEAGEPGTTAPDLEVMRARSIADKQRADAILGSADSNPAEALPLYENALRLDEELMKLAPEDGNYRRDVSVSYEGLGDLQLRLGTRPRRRHIIEKALAVREELVKLYPADVDFWRGVSVSYNRLADLQMQLGTRPRRRRIMNSPWPCARSW